MYEMTTRMPKTIKNTTKKSSQRLVDCCEPELAKALQDDEEVYENYLETYQEFDL